MLTWLFLGVLTYLVGIEEGYCQAIHFSIDDPTAEPVREASADPGQNSRSDDRRSGLVRAGCLSAGLWRSGCAASPSS